MRPLPSLVTITTVPVSATTKLAPVMPISAVSKCFRRASRAMEHSRAMSEVGALFSQS